MKQIDDSASIIRKLGEQINRFIIGELKKQGYDGIVTSHGSILLNLFKNDSLTMTELAELICKDRSTVTSLVSKLSSQGFVDICRSSEDKRSVQVSITNKGKELESVIIQISEDMFSKMYNNVSEKEHAEFYNTLQKITGNF